MGTAFPEVRPASRPAAQPAPRPAARSAAVPAADSRAESIDTVSTPTRPSPAESIESASTLPSVGSISPPDYDGPHRFTPPRGRAQNPWAATPQRSAAVPDHKHPQASDPDALPDEPHSRPVALPEGGFRCGEGVHALPLAALKKRDLTILSTATANAGPPWSRHGITAETRAQHVRWLRFIGDAARHRGPEPPDWPAADFVVRTVHRRRKDRGWTWSTTSTHMGSIAGAFKDIAMYVPRIQYRIHLKDSPAWTQAARHAQLRSVARPPEQAKPITRDQVIRVCESAPPPIACLVALAWITTARPGCVSQLKFQDIVRTSEGLAITFRRGKAVLLRKKPYTVTTVPGAFEKYLTLDGPPNHFLFHFPDPAGRKRFLDEMTATLRQTDPELESKSIRRGALQHMARRGVPADVLMTFSGHGSVAMLKVYLGHGVLLEDEAKRQRAAAQRSLAEGAIRSELLC